MKRNLYLAALLCAVSGSALADEPGMCKSMCASDQQTCRKDAVRLTDLDKDPFIAPYDKNSMANSARQGEVVPPTTRIAERQDFERRRSERTGRCDTAFQRCVRTCGASDASAGGSEILTKQGQAKRGGAGRSQ
jgi:hypothetical protein